MTTPTLPALRSASHAVTNDKVFQIIERRLHQGAKVLDVGCGAGHMTRRMAHWFSQRGLDPKAHVFATDIAEAEFQAREASFKTLDLKEPLPFADASFDVVVSIEVIEHLPRPYDFLAEIKRVLRPGGILVLSTPNIGHMKSRVRSLFMGLPDLYEFPTTDMSKAGRLCGHIMPLTITYLLYGLRRAGFARFTQHTDRRQTTSTVLYYLFFPALWIARGLLDRHAQAYDKAVYEENKDVMARLNGFEALTSRSILLEAEVAGR